MKWKLKITNFGKIREAEIHNSSLRFIVGNNNSGKSYLMTLLWGMGHIITYSTKNTSISKKLDLSFWISEEQYKKILDGEKFEFRFLDYADIVNRNINYILRKTKDKFVSDLFNSENVKIENLLAQFDFEASDKFTIFYEHTDVNIFKVSVNSKERQIIINDVDKNGSEKHKDSILFIVGYILLESVFSELYLKHEKEVYLPAARTGFMLTKDIINKSGRRIAFAKEENTYEPFTMPIIEFLDIMDNITPEAKPKNKYSDTCDLIEEKMLQGKLLIKDNPSKAISFIPMGTQQNLPLRMSSAVVTEVAPLYLLLKNKIGFSKIKSLYYEEPEMCLHPQLQQVMARVLIKLANAGVNLTVTTHSDIIIQHINNMVKLSNHNRRDKLMAKYSYEEDDLLSSLDISLYQFEENGDGTTTLKELNSGYYGFEVPTFNNALDSILEEVYALQGESE